MKHTPTPWRFDHLKMKIKGTDDVNYMTIIANISPNMDYSRGMNTQRANAERIVACVNAMEGIENPEEFMKLQAAEIKRLNEMVELMRRTIEKDNLHRF